MAFKDIAAEVAEEFYGLSSSLDFKERNGYQYRDGAIVAAARRDMGNNRAEAVLRVKLWKLKQLKNPILAAYYRSRAKQNGRDYYLRNRHTDKFKETHRKSYRKRMEAIKSDPKAYAIYLKRFRDFRAKKSRERGAKVLFAGRMRGILAWMHGVDLVRADDLMLEFSINRRWSSKVLSRLTKSGAIVRISKGAYRVNK